MSDAFVLGGVAYDPKVVTIWDGFVRWFEAQGFAFDYVLYTHYERLVEAQFAGAVHCAWNSPLAWIESERLAARLGRAARAVAMRDTDQDLTSVVVVRRDGDVKSVGDLRGRRVGVGAHDSPQATILPLAHLAAQGLEPRRDFEVVAHDVLVGKHGDHVGGERDAVVALTKGEVDAACIIGANQLAFAQEGVFAPGTLRILSETPPYDHCVFTVVDDAVDASALARFDELLLSMSFDDPEVRSLLELEGLRVWRPGRTSGFAQLEAAVDALGLYGADGSLTDPEYRP